MWGRWLKGGHEEASPVVSSIVPESQSLTVAFTVGGGPPDLRLLHRGSDYRPPQTARQFVA